MKKAISILLALAICLALCACGHDNKGEESYDKPTNGTTDGQTSSTHNKKDIDSILADINAVAETAEEAIASKAKSLVEKLGDTYETYDDNKASISEFYSSILNDAEENFTTLQAMGIDCYTYIAAQGLEDYNTWDDAMEDVYDALEEAYEDIYDALDEAYEDVYNACDNSIENAYDVLDYEEAFSIWTEMSDAYWIAWEDMSDTYWIVWEDMSDTYWAVWSGFSNGETDVNAILKAAAENAGTEETTIPNETTIPEETTVHEEPTIPEETNTPEDTKSGLEDGMRPEFKEAMDAYEAFYDEYCEFIAEYNENPSDTTLLIKYGELLVKAEEMDKAFEEWDEDEMNDAELKYYLEVSTRVMQKLIDVAG